MLKMLALLPAFALAGCAATVQATSPRSAVVHAPSVAKAQAAADTECGKHRRFAQFVQERPEFVFTFHCVE
jgi:hypothetical protein